MITPRPSFKRLQCLAVILGCIASSAYAPQALASPAAKEASKKTSNAAPASPLGFVIGAENCKEIRSKFAAAEDSPAEEAEPAADANQITASDPGAIYPGASYIVATCSNEDRLLMMEIRVGKGGIANEATRAAYKMLSSRYKHVAGNPMPAIGDGYARFVAGDSVIEQSAPHMSFEFTLAYYQKDLYDRIKNINALLKKYNKQKLSNL